MMNTALRIVNFFLLLLIHVLLFFAATQLHAQQPQTGIGSSQQALQHYNSMWANGVSPGYYPTCTSSTCASLSLTLNAGTCFDSSGARHAYAGGTLTMTASSSNYIYLTASSCAVTQNTTGYPATGVMPIATIVTSGSAITAKTDDRTWFGGAGGTSGGGTSTTVHTCYAVIGDPSINSPTLQTTNTAPGMCGNNFGTDITIIAAGLCVDAGASVFNVTTTGGGSTSVLTGAITGSALCSSNTWTAGTVNGTPLVHSFAADAATCGSTPCTLAITPTSVDGVTKYAVMQIVFTSPGGTGTGTMGVGGCAANQICVNVGGLVSGLGNCIAGFFFKSNGTSSLPSCQAFFTASTPVLATDGSGNPTTATGAGVASILNCPDSSGSGTAQVCNTTPTFTPAGGTGGPNSCVWYTTTTQNSGTGLTVNINSLGAKSVAIPGSVGWTTTLTANIIPANKPILMCYDGTNWDVQQTGTASSGGGSVTPETHIASSSADITFSTCFSSSYSVYQINVRGLVPATNNSQPKIQFHISGGAWDTSNIYNWTQINSAMGTSSTGANGTANTSGIVIFGDGSGGGISNSTTGSTDLDAVFFITNPLSSSSYKVVTGGGVGVYFSGPTYYGFTFHGIYKAINAVDQFRIIMSSGNINSGVVTCVPVVQ